MKTFLKLVRWPNLLIVAFTMILMRYAVIEPVISKITVSIIGGTGEMTPMSLKFPWYDFLILILATVCLTAGGYVINDYFDIRTDLINRGEVIVGSKVPRRQAMLWHNILNIIGVAAGFYISWKAGYFWMGLLFLIVSGLLYFYSASYKRQFLVGNLVVAVLTAMVPLLVVFYEWPALYRYYEVNAFISPDVNVIFYWVGGFALFAFITTLTREIIKDIEDFEGDMAYGRNTVPVVTGILTARIIAIALTLVTLGLLFFVWNIFLHDKITLIYISVAVVVPLAIVIYRLILSPGKSQLHSASRLMKVAQCSGVLYSVVVKLILDFNLI
ncbi:MAG: geranylgeranylglycerol-phosphate geranylgeranyltransferase [Bacteroidales bacterium]